MRLFTRLIGCMAAAMLLSAALFHAADSWSSDEMTFLEACRQLMLEAERTESLEARAEVIARSRSLKCDIIQQLLAGRMSFRQAIVEFQRANEIVDKSRLDLIPAYRLPTDPKRVGRQVFFWARNSVGSQPSDKTQRLLSGFRREYQTLFGGANPDQAEGA